MRERERHIQHLFFDGRQDVFVRFVMSFAHLRYRLCTEFSCKRSGRGDDLLEEPEV
jgi:hypothetical protein